MSVKLIALDIDGTLINSRMEITEETVRALTAAAERGIRIVLSTGRPTVECRHILNKLPCIDYVNGCTGARVEELKTGRIIAEYSVDIAEAKRLCSKVSDLDLMVCALDPVLGRYHAHRPVLEKAIARSAPHVTQHLQDYYVPVEDMDAYLDSLDRVIKFYYPCFTEQTIEEVKTRLADEPYAVVQCGPMDVELCPEGSDKGTGLRMLAEALGIAPEEIMAIGDSENDLAMLRYAGLPVVMGNGSAEAKALAKYITDDNDHDGVAKAVDMVLEGTLWNS